jgi:hypothetical protein
MLIIQQGEASTLLVTATEKVTIDPPVFFLFSFESLLTNEIYNVILSDTSPHPSRYNEFSISSAQAANMEPGEHVYTIFAQNSNSNTDPAEADEVVETGLVIVRRAQA